MERERREKLSKAGGDRKTLMGREKVRDRETKRGKKEKRRRDSERLM